MRDLRLEGPKLGVSGGLYLVDPCPDGRREPVVVLHYRGTHGPAACGAPVYVLCAVEVELVLMGISKPPSTCRL